jgi:hypothetical protein
MYHKNKIMIEIIFTSRPLSKKPISWINAITRMKTRSPFDHVSLKYRGDIYESVGGEGVHKIPFDEWIKDRKDTYLFIYQVDREDVSFNRFRELEGLEYDYAANFWHLFNRKNKLKKRANKKMYCSELIANMMGMSDAHEVTPDLLERRLRDFNSYITEI